MKKVLSLLGIVALMSSISFAYINENETSDVDTIKAQGFSTSMQEAVDFVNYANRGKNSDYERRFVKKDHEGRGKFWQKVKYYIDPIQDDGNFGHREVPFSNTWNSDSPDYASELENKAEDL